MQKSSPRKPENPAKIAVKGRFVPHLSLLLAMLVWSSSFIALKLALSGLTPIQTMAGRMFTACIIFVPIWPGLFRAIRQQGQVGALLLLGLCEPCLYFLFETHALQLTTASQAGMVSCLLPLLVAVAAWPLLHERISPRGWLGLGLAALGVIWLSLAATPEKGAPAPLLGNALEALAMTCGACYTIAVRRLSYSYTALQITAVQSGIGLIFFALLLLLPASPTRIELGMDLPAWLPWASVVYLGACVTLGGYGLYNYGVQRLGAGQAAAYINLLPVMTLAMGVALLNEVFLPEQYLAAGLIILGLVLSQWRGKERG